MGSSRFDLGRVRVRWGRGRGHRGKFYKREREREIV